MTKSTRRPDGGPAASRRCRACGVQFVGEPWQRLCWPCWREQRGERDREATYDRGFTDGYRAGSGSAVREAFGSNLDPDLVARAARLCHPDRHPPERFAEANAVTAELLSLRQKLAA